MRPSALAGLILLAAACSSGSQPTPAPAPAPAQSGAAPAVATGCPLEQGSMVLRTEFTSTGERAALALQAGCLYWATTDVSGIQLQLRPRVSGTQRPYMGSVMGGGVTGGQTWEIRATNSGEFEIWATGAPAGRAVKLEVTVRGPLKS